MKTLPCLFFGETHTRMFLVANSGCALKKHFRFLFYKRQRNKTENWKLTTRDSTSQRSRESRSSSVGPAPLHGGWRRNVTGTGTILAEMPCNNCCFQLHCSLALQRHRTMSTCQPNGRESEERNRRLSQSQVHNLPEGNCSNTRKKLIHFPHRIPP